MSLQFYFGASGAGKSKKLHDDIIEESLRHPKKNYLLIVPDQFTMQTQMDLVVEHPRHAIMNIDVLSFGRLTHRVLEEVAERICRFWMIRERVWCFARWREESGKILRRSEAICIKSAIFMK